MCAIKGTISPKKGKTYEELYGEEKAKELKENIVKSLTGKPSNSKGKKRNELQRKNISNGHKGLKQSLEQRKKTSIKMSGRGNPGYIDGRSKLPYCEKFDDKLKELIRKRDNHQCQFPGCLCSNLECILLYKNSLHIHHIHYDKINCYPDLITLCLKHNSIVNFNRDYYESLFMNMLNNRGLLFWTRRNIK